MPRAESATGKWVSGENHPVHDRVDDLAFVHNDENCAREADQEPGESHRFEPFDERFRRPADPESADQANHDAHAKEEGRHLVEVPSEPHHAEDKEGESSDHDEENGQLARGEIAGLGAAIRLRFNPRFRRVTHRAYSPKCDCEDEKDDAKTQARETRQTGQFLGDADLEWIDRAEGRTNRSRADAHRDRGHRVVTHPARKQQENRDERDDFLGQIFQDTARREKSADDRNHEHLAVAQHAD